MKRVIIKASQSESRHRGSGAEYVDKLIEEIENSRVSDREILDFYNSCLTSDEAIDILEELIDVYVLEDAAERLGWSD